MTDKRKVQLETEVVADTSGLDAVADAFQQVAQVGKEAGQQAAQGLNAISNAAEPAAQKLEAAERRMQQAVERRVAAMRAGAQGTADYFEAISRARNVNTAPFEAQIAELRALEQAQKSAQKATQDASRADAFITSLKQQAEAAGRTRSEVLALQAAELGLGDKAAQYIQRLRQIEQGQNQVGMSARATAAALRGVPAQFTDIATSLASGQRPLQVLLQQGGQLKDMFGGIGPAARALGGYILGLVNPYTVAAAAVAVLGVELARTESRLRELNSVQALLAGTGRSGLFPTADLKEFISELSKAPGVSREVATQIVTEFAKAHDIGGALFKDLGKLAVDYARATGTDIPAAARTLAKAFSDPEKGAKQLEEALGSLTSSQLIAVERLTRLGDVAGAQRVMFDALSGSISGLAEKSLTPMGRAINELGNAWERLGQRMDQSQGLRTVNELLAKTVRSIAWLIDNADKVPTWALFMIPGGGLPAALARGGEQTFRGRGATGSFEAPTTGGTPTAAAADDEIKRALEAAKAYRSQAGQITELTERRTAFNKALQESIALYGKDAEQSKRLRDAIAGINEQIAKTQGQGANEAADAKAKRLAMQDEIKQLKSDQERLLTGDSRLDKQTDAEKQVIKLREEIAVTTNAIARAAKERALAEAKAMIPLEQSRNQEKQIVEDLKESLTTRTKNIDAIGAESTRIREAAIAQEAANASTGKSKTAIEEETLAKFKAAAADEVLAKLDPERHAAMQQRIADQERFVNALKASEAQQIKARQIEEGRALQEDAQTLQLELSLLGRTREERERILAQRRVEVDLAKEIAGIDRSGATEAEKEERRATARANAQVKAQNAANKSTLDEWQRTADSIESSLTDALLRGFESGKGFASNLKDTLKNMFSTLVLRPVVQAIMAPVSGALAGIGQGLGQQVVGGGGSGASGILGAVGSIGSLFGAGGLSGSLAAGAGWLTGASTLTGSLSAAGSLIGTGTAGGILSGLGMGLGALGPIGIAAGIAASLLVKKGGGPKTESGFGLDVPLRGDPAASQAVAQAIQQQYKAIAGQLAKDLQVGVFSATDPQGTAKTQLAVQAALGGTSIYSRGGRLGGIENVGRSPEELQAAITEESNRVILQALAATGLPDKIGAYLRQLGDVDKLSGGALQEAVTKLQAAMTQRATLEAQLFDLTHTELERVAEARRKERDAIDDTNRALFDHVAALTDLTAAQTAAKDSLLSAFQTQSDVLKGTIDRNQNAAQQLRDLRDSFSADGLTTAQRRALASGRFSSTLTGAIGGDATALQNIGGASKDFIEAVKATARTPVEVAAAVAKVQAGLTTAATAAEGRATVAQQQLDAMTAQLSALGLINTSVLTVGEALGAYLRAQTGIQAENLRYTSQLAIDQAATAETVAAAAAVVTATSAPVTTADSLLDRIRQQRLAFEAIEAGAGGAAVGGYRSGVVRVGELGEEMVDFETPGRVYTNEQTRGMFASNAAIEPLLRQVVQLLQAGNADRRREAVAIIAPLVGINSRQKKWDTQGIPLGEDMLAAGVV